MPSIKNSSSIATTKYHSEKRARGGIDFDGRRAGGAENTFLRSLHQEGSWGRRAPRGSGVLSASIGSFFISISPYTSFSELYRLPQPIIPAVAKGSCKHAKVSPRELNSPLLLRLVAG